MEESARAGATILGRKRARGYMLEVFRAMMGKGRTDKGLFKQDSVLPCPILWMPQLDKHT